MSFIKRKCDNCGKEYLADERNLNRGWGLCCSKSCAAKKREMSKPGYAPERVARNNIRRAFWNSHTSRAKTCGIQSPDSELFTDDEIDSVYDQEEFNHSIMYPDFDADY